MSISSCIAETIVSASALGHQVHLSQANNSGGKISSDNFPNDPNHSQKILFHEGTLRSGDHLYAEGDVLLLGDVNPGAQISAGGNVMIWGRLRGIAHAGREGNTKARIIALQLRPLQLRIADAIARGPEEDPQPGLAEEASLKEGKIFIEPAKSKILES